MTWDLLQPAINLGLEEEKFWTMTIAEVDRFIKGARWRLQQKAQFDYCLANLIGISSARMLAPNEVKLPELEDVYSNLFEKKKVEDPKPIDEITQKSVNNFLARAMAINKNIKAKEKMEVNDK